MILYIYTILWSRDGHSIGSFQLSFHFKPSFVLHSKIQTVLLVSESVGWCWGSGRICNDLDKGFLNDGSIKIERLTGVPNVFWCFLCYLAREVRDLDQSYWAPLAETQGPMVHVKVTEAPNIFFSSIAGGRSATVLSMGWQCLQQSYAATCK